MDDHSNCEVRVLLLRAPGAQSDRLGELSDELAEEIVASAGCATKVISAVGTPDDGLPFEYDVLAWLDPGDGEIEVTVTHRATAFEQRFTLPSDSREELLEIARQVGEHTDAAHRSEHPTGEAQAL